MAPLAFVGRNASGVGAGMGRPVGYFITVLMAVTS
jgi:hypothetical protein